MIEEYERKLTDCRVELTNIRQWIDGNKLNSNVRYLVAYSVMKASGTIEVVFKLMIYDFLAENVKEETQYYLTKMVVDSSCNPNTNNMSKMLEQIDTARRTIFDNRVKGTQQKGDLNSLVVLRNDLAHGRTVNATINNVLKYYESGVYILNLLDEILSNAT